MTPDPPDNPTLRNLALAGLLLCALLGLAWWKSKIISQHQACRICAMEFDHKVLFFYGYRIKEWDTKVEASAETRNYFNPYLGYPHAHEWLSKSSPYIGAGARKSAPYPIRTRMDMTRVAYQLVAASGIPDAERRLRYFESIIEPADEQHLLRILTTWRNIARQLPKDSSGNPAPDHIWGPQMEGVMVPDVVRAGGFMPYPPEATPETPTPDADEPTR